MATKVEVQRNHSVGVDTHTVEGEPKDLSGLVNNAIKANDKFVTFSIPGGKKLSVTVVVHGEVTLLMPRPRGVCAPPGPFC